MISDLFFTYVAVHCFWKAEDILRWQADMGLKKDWANMSVKQQDDQIRGGVRVMRVVSSIGGAAALFSFGRHLL